MIHFKSLADYTFTEASTLFNKGFEGYLIPMNLPLDAFIGRFGNEGISAEHSIVMLEENTPVGFVLQGIREVDGKKIAWNGGTGIIPSHRGKGLSQRMMAYAESVLREQGVEIATLEVLSENEPAIKLYERMGYERKDRLLFLQQEGPIEADLPTGSEMNIKHFPAFQAIGTALFASIVPWQVDPSITPKVGGEVIVAEDAGQVLAAVLFRKRQTYGEEAEGITLFQTVAVDSTEGIEALKAVLAQALEFEKPLKRTTYNFATGDGRAVALLKGYGFSETTISQLFMIKELNEKS